MLLEDDEYESPREDDDEEDETLVDGVESRKFRSRTKPSDEVVRLWAQARRSTDDYSAEDWKKTPANADVKSYTSHPGARSFKAPAVDSEAPALKYKERKDHEKKAEVVQSMIGAAGHIAAEMLVSADEEVARITQTIYEFEDPETEILDARKETAEILGAIRGSFFHRFQMVDL